MLRERVVKVGFGDARAPEGTEPWAQWWAGQVRRYKRDMILDPSIFAIEVERGAKFEAWKLLKGPDGKPFRDFDAFCLAPDPYGLDTQPSVVKNLVEIATGKRFLDLLTVAPARPGPGRGKTSAPGADVSTNDRKQQQLRAISERAPEPVRDLYRQDLIGVKEAAALGPKNPTPEVAAHVTAVAIEAKRVAKDTNDKKAVNAAVREGLGKRPDPVAAIVRAIAKLPPKRLDELGRRLKEELGISF